MQKNTHSQYYSDCQVNCACGHKFTTGSTLAKIDVEICSHCHPFYTGTQKFADIKGRIDKFKQKVAKGQEFAKAKTAKAIKTKKKKIKAKKLQ